MKIQLFSIKPDMRDVQKCKITPFFILNFLSLREGVIKLEVPLLVEIEYGNDWYQAK